MSKQTSNGQNVQGGGLIGELWIWYIDVEEKRPGLPSALEFQKNTWY